MAATRGGRVYERYGWIILLVGAVLGLLTGLALTFAPLSIMVEPAFAAGNVTGVLRAWGITWIFFNIFALVILLRNFRKGERWAWWVLWLLPLLWLFHFLFNPFTVQNLLIAVITALGLVLPYRRFFSASADQPSHVG
jgi:ABC-type antimicrobial peptide transport system permease subunit